MEPAAATNSIGVVCKLNISATVNSTEKTLGTSLKKANVPVPSCKV